MSIKRGSQAWGSRDGAHGLPGNTAEIEKKLVALWGKAGCWRGLSRERADRPQPRVIPFQIPQGHKSS